MKKLALLALVAGMGFFSACSDKSESEANAASDAKEEAKASSESQKYVVNVAESKINWRGEKNEDYFHTGTVGLLGGELDVEDGKITAGNFEIDMASITVTDLEGEKKMQLEGHLKQDVFFGVEENPTGKFTVTGFNPEDGSLSGNLELKGIEKNITFPVTMSMKDGKLMASAEVVINRTDWNVSYGSESLLGEAKDDAISDDIKLKINLVGEVASE